MEYIKDICEFVINPSDHLQLMIQNMGWWAYLILFLVIFAETGLVVTPFLPGDSLLFMIGTFCATGALDVGAAFAILTLAAVGGDTANYATGQFIGPRAFRFNDGIFFKKKHLDRTCRFYEKYGARTIVLARFIPIIRTFAPFAAGIGRMSYRRFFAFNAVGGAAWIAIFVFGGFWFGNIALVKDNLNAVLLIIVFVSVLPIAAHWFNRQRSDQRKGEPLMDVSTERAK